jgi:hypothetical protein
MEVRSATSLIQPILPNQTKTAERTVAQIQFRGLKISEEAGKNQREVKLGRAVMAQEANAVLEQIRRLEPYNARGLVGSAVSQTAQEPTAAVNGAAAGQIQSAPEATAPVLRAPAADQAPAVLQSAVNTAAGIAAAAPAAPVVPQPVADDPFINGSRERNAISSGKALLVD